MDGVNGVGNTGDVNPLQGLAAQSRSEEDEFFESDEFLEIIVSIGVSNLMFHYTMSRILEVSTTDVIIEAMGINE